MAENSRSLPPPDIVPSTRTKIKSDHFQDPSSDQSCALPGGNNAEALQTCVLTIIPAVNAIDETSFDIVAVHGYGDFDGSAWCCEAVLKPTTVAPHAANKTTRQEQPPEFDEKFEERVRKDFLTAGYGKEIIDSIIKRNLKGRKMLEKQSGAKAPVAGKSPLVRVPTIPGPTINWLKDKHMLPSAFKMARILDFQWPEPSSADPVPIEAIVRALRNQLFESRDDCPDRPLVLVGHDFGIVIIEKLIIELTRTQEEEDRPLAPLTQRQQLDCVAGLVFLSTSVEPRTAEERTIGYLADTGARVNPGSKLVKFTNMTDPEFVSHHVHTFKGALRKIEKSSVAPSLYRIKCHGKIFGDTDDVYRAIRSCIELSSVHHELFASAALGDEKALDIVLARGVKPELQNWAGQTALHVAVLKNWTDMVRGLVIKHAVNIRMQDFKGQTALHVAVKGKSDEIVRILLSRGEGADLEIKDNKGYTVSRAARHASDEIKELLRNRPLVQGPSRKPPVRWQPPQAPDRLTEGYIFEGNMMAKACRSFVAVVADFFFDEDRKLEERVVESTSVYELLYGAGPEKILQTVRHSSKKGMQEQCRWIHIPANNVLWVKDLFTQLKFSNESLFDGQHDGSTAWSRFMRAQASELKLQKFSETVADYQDASAKPTSKNETIGEEASWQLEDVPGGNFALFMPYLHYEDHEDQKRVQRTVRFAAMLEDRRTDVANLQAWWAEMLSLIENPKPDLNLTNVAEPRQTDDGETDGPNAANVMDVPSEQRSVRELVQTPEEVEPEDHDNSDDSQSSRNPPVSHHSQQSDQLGLPSSDSESQTISRMQPFPGPDIQIYRHLNAEQTLIKAYLYDPPSLHMRRTLDQSHYFMLEDTEYWKEMGYRDATEYRDATQVVMKEAERLKQAKKAKQTGAIRHRAERTNLQMIMVDQLWLWVVGNCIVTSFPQKWSKDVKDQGDVLVRVRGRLQDKARAPIKSSLDLASLIVAECSNVFVRARASVALPMHDLFESAIGDKANQEMLTFQRFSRALKETETDGIEQKNNTKGLFDIRKEVKILEEIKDIRDETRMVLKIFREQASVLGDFGTILGLDDTAWDAFDRVSLTQHRVVEPNIKDFERMENHSEALEKALNHSLDLKQKEANVSEARNASARALAAEKQQNTITFFTIVTIIFGALSFVTAFFALNVVTFPKQNGTTLWQLSHIVGYVVGLSIAVSAPLVVIAVYINKVIQLWDRLPQILVLLKRLFNDYKNKRARALRTLQRRRQRQKRGRRSDDPENVDEDPRIPYPPSSSELTISTVSGVRARRR